MPLEWPLPIWQILHEELRQLRPAQNLTSKAAPAAFAVAEWEFRENEILDPAAIQDGVAARAKQIAKIGGPAPGAAQLETLNELLRNARLHLAFRDVPEHRWVAGQKPEQLPEQEVAMLNRYLLERIFAGAVKPIADRILPDTVADLHAAKLSALCFSGGGIRSATFCLGIIQGLARGELLDKFDYLSTVSGGGYVGGWLEAWIYHENNDLARVTNALTKPTGSKLEPDPDPIFYLRNFSNYLTPRTGLLSLDTWTLAGIYLRNLLLNWTIIVPLLMVVFALPYLALALAHVAAQFASDATYYWTAAGLLGLAVGYELATRPGHLGDFRSRAPFTRFLSSTHGFLVSFAIPSYGSFLLFARFLHRASAAPMHCFIVYGAAPAIVGWVLHLIFIRRVYLRDLFVMLAIGAAGGVLLFWLWRHTALENLLAADARWYVLLAPPLMASVFLVTATVFIGLVSWWSDDEDREYWARMGAWILIVQVAWLALFALGLFSPGLLLGAPSRLKKAWAVVTAVGGAVATIFSWSSFTPAKNTKSISATGAALTAAVSILGGVAIIGILAGIVLVNALVLGHFIAVAPAQLAGWIADGRGWSEAGAMRLLWVIAIFIVACLMVSSLMGLFVDVNNFSLHGMYRNRLIRAYLGASRRKSERRPNWFTGFDRNDNLQMSELGTPRKLLPVINTTLNLVQSAPQQLSWQERKAESYTMTPLHSGNHRSGYRLSRKYGGVSLRVPGVHDFHRDRIHAVSLGTAIAISGAAVSPNMGYISSPVLTFLLALLNLRLGWWLGNPGPAGNHTYELSRPQFATRLFLNEALGRTDDQRPYVYLSDGGHFENLGLYEMVLRRCHTIVAIDADADGKFTFSNLGNAIRKIRIDLGINIDFKDFPHFGKRGGAEKPTVYCAVGTIHYDAVDADAPDGRLIYVKPTIRSDEAADVLNYESAHPEFPHESTADQWFSESQFESYRALGLWEMERIRDHRIEGDPHAPAYREAAEILERLKPHPAPPL
ncbi:MAG TPA: hypothetical protein VIX59_05015 [Candidatus Binataceae bacterium]